MFEDKLGDLKVSLVLPSCEEKSENIKDSFQVAMKRFLDLKGTEGSVKINYSVASTLSGGAIESSGQTGSQYRNNGLYDELASTLGFNVNECEIGIYSDGSNKYTMYVVNGKFDNSNPIESLQQMSIGNLSTANNFKYGTPTKTTKNVTSGEVYAMKYTFSKTSDNQIIFDTENSLQMEKIYAWINTSSNGLKWLKFNSPKDLID